MFDAFAQENSWDPSHMGSGLGLAICRNIVGLMNGKIEVESSKGKGSVFTVTVQLELDQEKTAAVSAKEPDDKNRVIRIQKQLAGKHILLAEDHAMNQEIEKYVLEHAGMVVDTADNGRKVCEMFAASAPGCYAAIIMDVRMPEMDGLTAARTIRAMKRTDAADIPIIAMSADAFESDISKSLASGMNAHLTKPINPEQVFRTLARCFYKT